MSGGLAGGAALEADLDEATAAAFRKKIGSWLQQNDVAADPEITAQCVESSGPPACLPAVLALPCRPAPRHIALLGPPTSVCIVS
jgi:hypothetical protein